MINNQDVKGARKLLSIDLDDLPAELLKATKTQIGLAWHGSMRYVTKTTLKFLTNDEGYRHELIVKEMCRRGFQTFGGCLANYTEDELDKISNELSLQLEKMRAEQKRQPQ